MRIVLVGLISLAATTLSFGQGTVNFQNSTALANPLHLTTPPDRLVRFGPSAQFLSGAFVNGSGAFSNSVNVGLRAQLYYGSSVAPEGSLVAVSTAPVSFLPSTSVNVGVWRAPASAVPLDTVAPSNTANLIVKVYDSTYAPSYEAAVAIGVAYPGLLGKSSVFSYTAPDTNSPTSLTDYNMTNYTTFSITAPSQEGPAAIATNPASLVKIVGETAIFSVGGAGAPTLGYQWYKSPATPVGINSKDLTLSNVQLTTAGGYYCVVTNGSGSATSTVATLTVNCPTITISSSDQPLTNGSFGSSYSATFVASGGTAPYTYAVTGGALPASLNLSSAGVLSGTVTDVPGPYNFTVTATDNGGSLCTGSSNYTITLDCPVITISPSSLPTPAVGTAYSETVSGVGGASPYTYALNTNSPYGPLPTGLSLNETNGVVSGTPTVPATFIYQIIATDANGCTGSQDYTNTVGSGGAASGITLDVPKTKTDDPNATITTAGKLVPDPNGFSSVTVYANGVAQSGATIHTNGSKITWTNSSVALAVGTNQVYARLVNGQGGTAFSKTNAVFRRFQTTVTIANIGNGIGVTTGKPLKTPSVPGGTTPALGANSLDVGRTYTISAIPDKPTSLISNIYTVVNGVTNVAWTPPIPSKDGIKGNKKFAFLVYPNMQVLVNYVTNRFINAGGVYYGLYMEGTTAHESSGWFTIKVDSKLKFTGRLLQEGTTVPFSGTFDLAGVGTPKVGKNISRKLYLNDILTLGLQLDMGTSVNLSGTVASTNWGGAAAMAADKSIDGGKIPLPLPTSVTAPFAMVMVGSATPATLPGGDGYILNSKGIDPAKGKFNAKGYTGEGAGVKMKSFTTGVFTNGSWPFYAQLYKDTGDKTHYHGAMIGWLTINTGAVSTVSGDIVWTKQASAGPVTPGVPYSGGFTTMFSSGSSTLLSSPVTLGSSGANLPGLASALTLTIQDGGYLPSPFTTNLTYSLGKISPKIASGIKVIIKTTAAANGQVDLIPNKWFGVALQNSGTIHGAFSTGGATSGSVRLTP